MNPLFTIALLLGIAAYSHAAEQLHLEQETGNAPQINIEIVHGEISIVAGDTQAVQVRGELADAVSDYTFEHSDNTVVFDVLYPHSPGKSASFGGSPSKLEFKVPGSSSLNLVIGSGKLSITGLSGGASIESKDASVELNKLGNNVRVQNVNGPVLLNDLSGSVEVETVNGQLIDQGSKGTLQVIATHGPVRIDSHYERIQVENISGNVTVTTDTARNMEIETISGHITASLALADGGELTLNSVNGDIALTIGPDTSAEFSVESPEQANIFNRLTPSQIPGDDDIDITTLQFTLGEGKGSVNIRNTSGRIILQAR